MGAFMSNNLTFNMGVLIYDLSAVIIIFLGNNLTHNMEPFWVRILRLTCGALLGENITHNMGAFLSTNLTLNIGGGGLFR